MRHYVHVSIGVLAILIASTIVVGIAFAAPPVQTLPPDHPPVQSAVPDRPSASQGIAIYAESCAPCHGDTGKGDGPAASGLPNPPTAFVNPEPLRLRSPQEIFTVIKEGRLERGMPPWKNRLSDEAVWSVAAYILDLNLGKDGYTRGRTIYTETCAACHGDTGKGDGPLAGNMDVPDLTRWSDWTNVSNRQWLETIGKDTVHQEAVKSLSQEDLDTVIAYVRTLTYSSSLAPFSGNGILQGTVKMLTQDMTADFEGLPVTLFGFRGSMEPQLVVTTTVQADNTFRFEGLSTEPDALYSLSTKWEDVPYSSGVITFPPGERSITVTLSLAATTEEDPGLKADRVHWFLDFDQDGVVVGELISISNPGDRAYIGQPIPGREGKRAVIRWPLPADATDLQVDGGTLGERFFFEEGALIDTLPIPPGTDVRRLLFQYRLPVVRNRVNFRHPLGMPVAFLNVFIADRGEKVKAPPNMVAGSPQDVGGTTFRSYVAGNLAAGEEVTFTLSNVGAATRGASSFPATRSTVRLVGIGLAAVIGLLLFGGLFYLSRQRVVTTGRPELLRRRRDALLAQIAALDVRFQQGELDEPSYREERDLLMAEAVRLTMLLDEDA